MSRWLGVSWSPAAFFRFSWVAALRCSGEDLSEGCCAAVPPVSWTLGSLDPPLRTTFLGGGQGFKPVESAFVDPAEVDTAAVEPTLVDSGFVDPRSVDPAAVEFAVSVALPAAVFSAVGASEQLGGIVFSRRARAGVGLA